MSIYFPMSARILTPGHIKCLKYLTAKDKVVVGLLTAEAMKGYKEEIVPYKDRKYILEHLNIDFQIVPQDSLNPINNLKKYECDTMASGDGWEQEEIDAANDLQINLLNIELEGERYSSSKILKL